MEWFSITHQFWIEKPIKSTSRLAFQKRPQKKICIEFITSSAICHWIIQAFKSMVSRAFSCFSIFALRRDIAHFLLSGAENPPFYRSLHAAECVVCLFFLVSLAMPNSFSIYINKTSVGNILNPLRVCVPTQWLCVTNDEKETEEYSRRCHSTLIRKCHNSTI